jgi:hypothetical protein
MTTEDVTCYTTEYSDLNGTDARKHYVTKGRDEGRQQHCAKNLTEYETITYITEYVEIQYEYGVDTNSSVTQNSVRDHFSKGGYKNRSVDPKEWD